MRYPCNSNLDLPARTCAQRCDPLESSHCSNHCEGGNQTDRRQRGQRETPVGCGAVMLLAAPPRVRQSEVSANSSTSWKNNDPILPILLHCPVPEHRFFARRAGPNQLYTCFIDRQAPLSRPPAPATPNLRRRSFRAQRPEQRHCGKWRVGPGSLFARALLHRAPVGIRALIRLPLRQLSEV